MLALEQLLQLDTGAQKLQDPVQHLGQPSSSQGTKLIPADNSASGLLKRCHHQFRILLTAQKGKAQPASYWHTSIALQGIFLNQTRILLSWSLAFYSTPFLEGRKEGKPEVKTMENVLLAFQKWRKIFSKHFLMNHRYHRVGIFMRVRLVKKSERKVTDRPQQAVPCTEMVTPVQVLNYPRRGKVPRSPRALSRVTWFLPYLPMPISWAHTTLTITSFVIGWWKVWERPTLGKEEDERAHATRDV